MIGKDRRGKNFEKQKLSQNKGLERILETAKRNGYDPQPGWEKFSREYPHIRSMNQANQQWLSMCENQETEDAIFVGLARWKKSDEWCRTKPVYNDAVSWLRDRLWTGTPAEFESPQQRENRQMIEMLRNL